MASHRMYDETPSIRHDADGKTSVKKAEKKAAVETKEEKKSDGALYARHLSELKDMFTRHEKEAGATEGSNDVGAPIKDIEKGAK